MSMAVTIGPSMYQQDDGDQATQQSSSQAKGRRGSAASEDAAAKTKADPLLERDEKKILKRMKAIHKKKGNQTCADCPAKNPLWLSFLIGIDEGERLVAICCETCVRHHHFELGSKRCTIKYSKMIHELSPENLIILEGCSNTDVNNKYEAALTTADFDKNLVLEDDEEESKRRGHFIKHKYKKCKYCQKDSDDNHNKKKKKEEKEEAVSHRKDPESRQREQQQVEYELNLEYQPEILVSKQQEAAEKETTTTTTKDEEEERSTSSSEQKLLSEMDIHELRKAAVLQMSNACTTKVDKNLSSHRRDRATKNRAVTNDSTTNPSTSTIKSGTKFSSAALMARSRRRSLISPYESSTTTTKEDLDDSATTNQNSKKSSSSAALTARSRRRRASLHCSPKRIRSRSLENISKGSATTTTTRKMKPSSKSFDEESGTALSFSPGSKNSSRNPRIPRDHHHHHDGAAPSFGKVFPKRTRSRSLENFNRKGSAAATTTTRKMKPSSKSFDEDSSTAFSFSAGSSKTATRKMKPSSKSFDEEICSALSFSAAGSKNSSRNPTRVARDHHHHHRHHDGVTPGGKMFPKRTRSKSMTHVGYNSKSAKNLGSAPLFEKSSSGDSVNTEPPKLERELLPDASKLEMAAAIAMSITTSAAGSSASKTSSRSPRIPRDQLKNEATPSGKVLPKRTRSKSMTHVGYNSKSAKNLVSAPLVEKIGSDGSVATMPPKIENTTTTTTAVGSTSIASASKTSSSRIPRLGRHHHRQPREGAVSNGKAFPKRTRSKSLTHLGSSPLVIQPSRSAEDLLAFTTESLSESNNTSGMSSSGKTSNSRRHHHHHHGHGEEVSPSDHHLHHHHGPALRRTRSKSLGHKEESRSSRRKTGARFPVNTSGSRSRSPKRRSPSPPKGRRRQRCQTTKPSTEHGDNNHNKEHNVHVTVGVEAVDHPITNRSSCLGDLLSTLPCVEPPKKADRGVSMAVFHESASSF